MSPADSAPPAAAESTRSTEWWRDAVVYQVYPRSFADSNGDGVGDLEGIRARLGYLELLGVDAIWLNPVMRSPMVDHGYDVSDPRDVDPLFGNLADLDALIAEAHSRDIRVVMDLVPNHTSRDHPWFHEALAAGPGSRARARYHFRDGRGPGGDEPPNNWPSIFGGPAWSRITEPDGRPGQWYLHVFSPEQPDLNWENDEVAADLDRTMRFWLGRGVDGFRIDVAHGMAKPLDLPDHDQWETTKLLEHYDTDPRFNNPAVHDIHRRIRRVLDEKPGTVAIGEIWVDDHEKFAEYLRPDELHLGFDFHLTLAPWDAGKIREAIELGSAAVAPVSATTTWTLSNHDVDREVTRYGGGEIGLARARAMILVVFALPGTVFVYNGAELGLPNVDLPDEALQDPVWERSGHTERGRDGCRVPLPWEGSTPPFGFTSAGQGWLPQPPQWSELTVERQLEDTASTLSLYRLGLELRRARPECSGTEIAWYDSPPGCLAFRRGGGLTCALNTTDEAVDLPPGTVIVASAPVVDGRLPANSAAWLV
ncbi:glycoside hydrolase family 13 protein [Rhodococcus chondri]|uniref:Glycoside hydrolase family 13 protein n=1 Tax=Rhodococcus chondri TaxID=3065941 RepID=A0ABU7JPA7_9NOCA|nr:glycoside hydrolase family 13 protein [Rhodococcus sp. CC-R104]MEE2031862.1 glycoside hydrolase family 13 protein [Rhodococcus sp. CC-R104]